MVSKNIDLKIWEKNHVVLYTNQGEIDSRSITVSFKDNNQESLNLSGKTVTIYAKKPDNTQIFSECIVNTENNTATTTLTSQFLSCDGMVECEFQIFENSEILLKVDGLKIVVFTDKNFSEAIESTSEYNVLIKALEQAQSFAENTGNVEDLKTTDKSSVIAAINELSEKTIPISQGGTGGTNTIDARSNLEVLKAYILYHNDSGNEGTITLNDSADNYDFLDIVEWDFYISRVYKRNNRPIGLMKIGGYGSQYLEFYSESISISGDTITRHGCTYLLLHSENILQFDYTKTIPIRTVIGYKY